MCKTLNAIGHGVWAQAIARRKRRFTKKSYEILKLVDDLKRGDKSDAYDSFSETLKLIGAAKLAGYIPDKSPTGRRLISCDEFWASLDEDAEEVSPETLWTERSSSPSLSPTRGHSTLTIRFTCPHCSAEHSLRFPLVLVDEAQDLSSINHAMLDKLVVQSAYCCWRPLAEHLCFSWSHVNLDGNAPRPI
jgi:hypothetical protein